MYAERDCRVSPVLEMVAGELVLQTLDQRFAAEEELAILIPECAQALERTAFIIERRFLVGRKGGEAEI